MISYHFLNKWEKKVKREENKEYQERLFKRYKDPIVLKIDWTPLNGFYLKYKLYHRGPQKIEIKPALTTIITAGFFILTSLLFSYLSYLIVLKKAYLFLLFFGLPSLGAFIVGIVFLFKSFKLFTFDKRTGFYWKGRIKKKFIALQEIHAIQINSGTAKTPSTRSNLRNLGGPRSELNLILHDGRRIRGIDYMGKRSGELADAIAQFLNIPVWNAIM